MTSINKKRILRTSIAVLLLHGFTAQAAPVRYEITITNGSQMPLSPGLIYTKNGSQSASPISSTSSAGFIDLCQSGDAPSRRTELLKDMSVTATALTNGPILPGKSFSTVIEVNDPLKQSVHFETMYGKTKDACGVVTINSHSLVALKQHVTSEVIQRDETVVTGAFADPVLPIGMTYLDPSVCATAANATACLRDLSAPSSGPALVRFFGGYLPSVVSALETKYGSAEVQTLLFPTSGAIQLKAKFKH